MALRGESMVVIDGRMTAAGRLNGARICAMRSLMPLFLKLAKPEGMRLIGRRVAQGVEESIAHLTSDVIQIVARLVVGLVVDGSCP